MSTAILVRRLDEVAVALFAFAIPYTLLLVLLETLLRPRTMAASQSLALTAAVIATVVVVLLRDRGASQLGVFLPPGKIAIDSLAGASTAIAVVGTAAAAIALATPLTHSAGTGFPWSLVVTVMLPAALHEELVFRGYVFQKIAKVSPSVAVVLGSTLFALVHKGNAAVGAVALVNIFLAGVILSLAFLIRRSLWTPIALHLVWNIATGPLLGHEVSGLVVPESLLLTHDPGPAWWTGGAFGMEGSLLLTLVEVVAVFTLLLALRSGRWVTPTQEEGSAG